MTAKRPWLQPLVPLYRLALTVKNAAYDRGWLRVRRLARPVVSVGSLSAGGAGKTPVVAMLGGLMHQHDLSVDVLSRGYGRPNGRPEQVELKYFASAERFGDEPVELMRSGLHVFVGAERYDAGLLAEQTLAAVGHLLDDGFQHRRLGRVLDIVLLTEKDIQDELLPAGDLREPLGSLKRADVVILRKEEEQRLRQVVKEHTQAEIWVIRRELVFEEEFAKPFLFCGIARPEGFFRMVQEAGYHPVGSITFPDHHAYTEGDIERILVEARAAGADGFYITGKDAVKLPRQWVQHLQTVGLVHAPSLRVALHDTMAAVRRLSEVLGRA